MTGQLLRGGAVICDVADVAWRHAVDRAGAASPDVVPPAADARSPARAARSASELVFTVARRLGRDGRGALDLVVGGWLIPIRIRQLRFRRAVAEVRHSS